jgi:threonine synthase
MRRGGQPSTGPAEDRRAKIGICRRSGVRYVSTRGAAPALGFEDVLLAGLAADGGLYVPESWPRLAGAEIRALAGLPYADLAVRVMGPFVEGAIEADDFAALVADSYRDFDHPEIAPLRDLGDDQWLLELFHGPTLAFKDFALQLLGRLFDHVLKKRGERVTIVGATSGDTGSAAIEACRDRAAIEIFILHPTGRVSEVQRRQMTTVASRNVHNIAIEGTFDDCQDLVKAMFADAAFRKRHNLSAVNSINWARIMAQVVYYFAAALRLGAPERAATFAVPTGNFGNVFAGYVAHRMGLPVARFVIGSNANDILTRFFETAEMAVRAVVPTISPSMDIQVSSNFERLLFELMGRDGSAVAAWMQAFRKQGAVRLDDPAMAEARALFAAARLDDDGTRRVIAELHRAAGILIDPHSAVGLYAGRARRRPGSPLVALATAHPAKFPEAVKAATGVAPAPPPRLAGIFDRKERFTVLPNDLGAVAEHIRDAVAQVGVR